MVFLKKILFFIIGLSLFLLTPSSVCGVTFDLIAPTEMLTRGQEVQFTINIDTGGKKITSTQIGMTYLTEYLQYLSTTRGNTFSTIITETLEGGKLIFTASHPAGFSGSGTFAIVTFRLIAGSPGSTKLCVLWAPTPSPQPTSPQPTPSPQPTSPQPTSLPESGSIQQTRNSIILGLGLVLAATTMFLFFNQKKSVFRHPKIPRQTLHK